MKLSNGLEVVPVEGEEAVDISNLFKAYSVGLVRVGPNRCLLPTAFTKFAEEYLNFEFRSTDIVIVTYPKCGTTWMQEIIWTMIHNPDLSNPDADQNLAVRSPFLEFDSLMEVLTKITGHNPVVVAALAKLAPKASPDDGLFLQLSKHVPNVRVIKTHLPFSLLPAKLLDTCKVVYVTRNPKDQVCSYMHHQRIIKVHDFIGTDEQFVDYFCKGDLLYGDYPAHLAEAVARRHHRNLQIYSYEELKNNNMLELTKLSKFLGIQRNEKQLENVAQKTTFSDMKKRMAKRLTEETDDANKNKDKEEEPNKPGFYRKGEAGSWKTDLKPALAARLDDWTETNITKPLGIKFSYGD